MNAEKFLKLKKQLEKKEQEKQQAQGAIEAHLSQLKKEFHCDNIEEAENLLSEMDEELDSLEEQFNEQLKTFEEELGKC